MSKRFFINLDNTEDIERYALSKFMEFTDNFDPITGDFFIELKKLTRAGQYTLRGEEKRLDEVSYKLFGDTQYWWLLMFYNNLKAIDDIKNGITINFPDLEELEDLYFRLKSKQLQDE